MPGPLNNHRREKFCHLIARGEISDAQAYEQAGFKARGHAAETNASKLKMTEEIVSRVGELRAPVLAEMEITTTKTIRRLAAIAFGDIGEVMRWGPKSVRVKPSEKLTPEQRAMIKEIKLHSSGAVTVTLRDPVQALRLLGLHQGLFAEEGSALTTTVNNDNRTTLVFVDRPPNETLEQWNARRGRELSGRPAIAGAAVVSADRPAK